MTSYHYRIKLKPVDQFFFGSEKHDKDLKTNYFVESNLYPQQTTLLGFVRYLMLVQNNALLNSKSNTVDRDKANRLIGKSSFDFTVPSQSFEQLESISPLYFIESQTVNENGKTKVIDTPYYFAPLDYYFDDVQNGLLLKDTKTYNAKLYYQFVKQQIVSMDGKTNKALSEIIKPQKQVGNQKPIDGDQENLEGFYKQTTYNLNPEWAMTIDATTSIKLKEETCFLPFGGEKCFFKVEIKETQPISLITPTSYNRSIPYIYFISDAFIPKSILLSANFGVVRNVSFRNFISKVETTQHFNRLSPEMNTTGLNRSSKYNLLQRGSVLYFNSNVEKNNAINEIKKINGNNIGFNQFLNN